MIESSADQTCWRANYRRFWGADRPMAFDRFDEGER
jgi:hypothetical protein